MYNNDEIQSRSYKRKEHTRKVKKTDFTKAKFVVAGASDRGFVENVETIRGHYARRCMVLTNEFVDGEQKGGSSGVYNRERERERERENRTKRGGGQDDGGDGGRLVGESARGVYFRTAGLFCGRRPEGKVQRPADDDQRGGCNGLLSWRPRISSLREPNFHPKTEANYASLPQGRGKKCSVKPKALGLTGIRAHARRS